jgi:hypothetical protein
MASMIDKVTWMFNCHSTMWLGKDCYDYDYKMTMHNDVDKYLQLMCNVMIYIIHHFVFSCVGVILGIFGEVWHAITSTTWQLMILQWLQVIWYGRKKPTPHLLTYLSIYLPTNPPTSLRTYLYTHQPAYLPTHTPTYLLQHAFLATYFLFLISYNLFTTYLIVL